jgi:hypothetical protein
MDVISNTILTSALAWTFQLWAPFGSQEIWEELYVPLVEPFFNFLQIPALSVNFLHILTKSRQSPRPDRDPGYLMKPFAVPGLAPRPSHAPLATPECWNG